MSYRHTLSKAKALVKRIRRTLQGKNLKSPVLFFHVPKCGGTSVKSAIFESLGIREYLRGEYFLLDAHASRKATDTLDAKMRVLRENVLAYELNRHPQPLFVTGHFIYSRQIHEQLAKQYTVVTIVRDPVKRFISQFFYNKNKQTQDHFGIDMDIDEYLDSDRAKGTGRLMTSYLVGNEALNNESVPVDELVAEAVQNMRQFDVVGVLSDMERFQHDFAQATGITIQIRHQRKNPTDKSKRDSVLTEERLGRIQALCAPDIRLYEAVINDSKAPD